MESSAKLRANLIRLVNQIKRGCPKAICFKPNCKKNLLMPQTFPNDQEILKFALSLIQTSSDVAALTCAEAVSLSKDPQPLQFDADPLFLISNLEWFCCSFAAPGMTSEENSVFEEPEDPYGRLQIDTSQLKQFYRHLTQTSNFQQHVAELLELIEHELSLQLPETQLMCTRGLFMLLSIDGLSDFAYTAISFDIIQMLNRACQGKCVRFLEAMPKEQLHEHVMSLQSLLTINIITGQINLQRLEQAVLLLDLLFRTNKKRDPENQVQSKEFQNDAVNNNLDLKQMMLQWARHTKQKAVAAPFLLCSYFWLLTTHNKALLLQMYNKVEWAIHSGNNMFAPQNYVLIVSRENILEDSLKKLVNVHRGAKDPLKMPLKIQFANEPGIDVGGVAREYFSLIIKELFNPAFGMFKFNESVQLYWFDGGTFEPNINFELVGVLMAIAFYNNMFLDMPLAPAVYKILLDQSPDLKDMAVWQPEIATSLQYVLDYQGQQPLEEVAGYFTASTKQFGEVTEVELCDQGRQRAVTMANREEFVRLRIQFEFLTHCHAQLDAFKKGFWRLADRKLLQDMLTPDDLEQIICGQRTLDFQELKKYCIYANGYQPNSPVVQWFWQIVLDEWDDAKRRALLAFATGSDRAPVNGLKSMKFYLIKDLEQASDLKLPTSHTCFNQLLVPEYSSKEILRAKLEQAIENSTGFGLV